MRLLLFGECARLAGARELKIRIIRSARLRELLARRKALSGLLRGRRAFKVAVNGRFRNFSCVVKPGDEVALMSPFSGG